MTTRKQVIGTILKHGKLMRSSMGSNYISLSGVGDLWSSMLYLDGIVELRSHLSGSEMGLVEKAMEDKKQKAKASSEQELLEHIESLDLSNYK